jgi:hypothetical protein
MAGPPAKRGQAHRRYAGMVDRNDALLENYRNAWAGLRLIREAVETLGPPGVLPSGEAVISLYGPEPIHEAQAIVDALTAILGDEPDRGTRRAPPRPISGGQPAATFRPAGHAAAHDRRRRPTGQQS